ncbi:MAG: efflux RND transporter periplasmic adaptor subunit [Bacteroidetes bacterium]|nr:efflux RND transporter periplasmic adaptor subunit [Bacteroidota bacterium]
MKKIIIIVIALAVLVFIVFRLSINYKKINVSKDVSTDLAYVSVNVSPVSKMSINDSLQLTGYMEAYFEIDIAAEAQGTITSLKAELGQEKSKGSIIATIDDKLKKLAVQTASISIAKHKKDLERYENLYKGGTITEQQLNEAQNLYDNAEIQLEQAEKQLSDATIKSPISGIITKKQVEEGEYINIGSPIATIVDISRLKIKLNVSETNVYQLKLDDKATITTDIYPGVSFEGSISFISSQGDDSHNYPVEIVIPNNSKYPLKSGTFANVMIKLPVAAEALYIPRESLLGSITEASVYVAENNKAILKKIVVGNGNDKFIKVISGLKEGEKVIVNGQINLSDNKAIKIVN